MTTQLYEQFITLTQSRAVSFKAWHGVAIVWLLLTSITTIRGFNHDIYAHNADLTLTGQQAYGRPGEHWISVTSPHYLDYPGSSHLLYVVLRATDGVKLYTVILSSLAAWLLYVFNGRSAALLLLHPMLLYGLLLNAWEDKLIFIVIPLLVLWLIEQGYWRWAALTIGLITAHNGILLFFAPAALWFHRSQWKLFLLYMALGFGVGMLPFFPDALSGWHYRAARMATDKPFWWSIWLPLRDIYAPNLDRAAVLLLTACVGYAFATRNLSLRTVMIWALVPILVLGVYNGHQRFTPFMVVALALMGASYRQYLWVWGLLLLYYPMRHLNPYTIEPVHVLIFYLPLLSLKKSTQQARAGSGFGNERTSPIARIPDR